MAVGSGSDDTNLARSTFHITEMMSFQNRWLASTKLWVQLPALEELKTKQNKQTKTQEFSHRIVTQRRKVSLKSLPKDKI